jgi:hypothetical protein
MLDTIWESLALCLEAVNDKVELVEEDHYEPVGTEDTDLLHSHDHVE